MKYISIPIIINIYLLMASLSVTSLAKLNCKQYQYSHDIQKSIDKVKQLLKIDDLSTSELTGNEPTSNNKTTTGKDLLHVSPPVNADSSNLLAESLQFLGAEGKTIDPDASWETTFIFGMHKNSYLKLLFSKTEVIMLPNGKKIIQWLNTPPTASSASTTDSANTLPDFFTTYALSKVEEKHPLLLLEKQTERTIKHAIERVEAYTTASSEAFHLFIKEKDSVDGVIPIHHTLIINKDNNGKAVAHFFDPKTFIYYKLPAENLPYFMSVCKQWANENNHIVEMYSAMHKAKYFQVPENGEPIILTHENLKETARLFCDEETVKSLRRKKKQHDHILHNVKDLSSLLKKKIDTPFVEWYHELPHTDAQKLFVLELSSSKYSNDQYAIELTQLNKDYYGLYLLEINGIKQDRHKHYILFPKNNINIIAKQWMLLFNSIEVHEIIQSAATLL